MSLSSTTNQPNISTTTMEYWRVALGPIMDELNFATYIQVISSFAAFFLNSAVLFVVVKKRLWRQNPSYILLTTIMVADIIVGGSLTSSTLWMLLYDQFLGPNYVRPCLNIECGMETWLYMVGATLDILMSLCLAADRLVSLAFPLWYRQKYGAMNYIFVAISAVISTAIAFGGPLYANEFKESSPGHGNFGGYKPDYAGYCSIATATLTYITISLCVIILILTLKKRIGGLDGGEMDAVTQRQLKRQKQITNLIATLIGSYVITISLGFTMLLVSPFIDTEHVQQYQLKVRLQAWGWAVIDMNPFLNGIVYIWKMEDLRGKIKEVMLPGFKKVQPAVTTKFVWGGYFSGQPHVTLSKDKE